MKQKLLLCAFCLVAFVILLIPKGACDSETAVNVSFQIFTGSGSSDYYSGEYFWYNITLQNSGTTVINATFTVTALNTTGGVMPTTHTFYRYLAPNDTTYLYPNYTRLGKEEVSIYFMDTAGTYTIELNSSQFMHYYRWYDETARYTVEPNVCHMGIDAMPSYERQQDDAWNQYLQNNNDYMSSVEHYIAQSRVEADNTKMLARISLAVAVLAILVDLFTLPKTRFKEKKGFIAITLIGLVLYIIIAFFIF